MWQWLERLLFREMAVVEAPAPLPPQLLAPPPPPTPALAPAELVEALDVVRKTARAQSKLALKVDEVDAGVSRRLDELRGVVDALAGRPAPAPAPAVAWSDLLDAMDLLQHAVDALDPARDDGVADGLRRVIARLDRFLAQGGIRRLGAPGEAADGRHFRVVGTETNPDLPAGRIARVVRAAAVRDDKVVREGEVLTVRGAS